ncbi:hypothetical protein ABEV54_18680 [Peribacillus psychrosaccharolyticus]|uniref:hypothetical protein n=1 Tax=Peribacillus psychrosaccharolyticus TaxID=1407 RepID=UPI003D29E143
MPFDDTESCRETLDSFFVLVRFGVGKNLYELGKSNLELRQNHLKFGKNKLELRKKWSSEPDFLVVAEPRFHSFSMFCPERVTKKPDTLILKAKSGWEESY